MTQSAVEVRKKCFVIMGFGEKVDYQSSPPRTLDLNRTFEDVIEPTITECNLECIRADKIIHSTVIDKPMYENLLGADLVIADLSTSNANALYELGVRHALRPHTTIVMAETGFKFPFDLNHVSILQYKHLGVGLEFREVMRVREQLKLRVSQLTQRLETDSPVFLFLPSLLGVTTASTPSAAPEQPRVDESSLAELNKLLWEAKASVKQPADWQKVIAVLARLRALQPDDPYVLQQHALATYKSQAPDPISALFAAKALLEKLQPEVSCDPETIGLWGAIHKRLWETTSQKNMLSTAVRAYARGYFIKNDYYNGINFAFLLNVRAANSSGDDAVADRVQARRIREEVLVLCDSALAELPKSADDAATWSNSKDTEFWIKATKVEALLGLSRAPESSAIKAELEASSSNAAWMLESMNAQLLKLAALSP